VALENGVLLPILELIQFSYICHLNGKVFALITFYYKQMIKYYV